jgi:hypothetical protein
VHEYTWIHNAWVQLCKLLVGKAKRKKGIDDGSRFKFDVFAVAPGQK